MTRLGFAAALAVAAGCALMAQQPGEVSLLGRSFVAPGSGPASVPVVVTDELGQPIPGLTSADFQVRDNGKPVTVSAREVSRPAAEANAAPRQRSITLLFDDLSSSTDALNWARRAAADYVDKGWAPGDRWAILTTSHTLQLPFTSDRAAVAATLAQVTSQGTAAQAVQLNARAKTNVMHGGGNADEQAQTISSHTLDGIASAIDYAAAQPGRSVLVFTSTGFATDFAANGTNLNDQLDRLRVSAIRSGVTIEGIDPAALDSSNTALRWQTETNVLSMLANNTGGVTVENRNELETAFDRLAGGSKVSYELAFAPAAAKTDTSFHRLEIAVNGHPQARVRALPGYYLSTGANDGITGPPALEKNLERSLNGEAIDQLPVEVKMAALQPAAGELGGVRVGILISPRQLPFKTVKGKQHDQLRVIALLDDAQGIAVAREGIIDLNLSPATRKKLDADGINAALDLPVAEGVYRLRIIVQEASTGATTVLTRNGLRLQR